MTLRRLLTINVPISAGFGIGCLVFPERLVNAYGASLSAAGIAMTQLAGAAFLGWGTLAFLARAGTPEFMHGAAIALLVQNAVATGVSVVAQAGGAFNWLGWTTPLVYGLLGAGYGYFVVTGVAKDQRPPPTEPVANA